MVDSIPTLGAALDQEARLRTLEHKQANADMVNAERHKQIERMFERATADIAEIRTLVQKRMDWLLYVIMAIALAAVFRNVPEVLQSIAAVRGGVVP